MKTKPAALLRDYLPALRKYLKQRPASGLAAAQVLGRRAEALGLETLDLARAHEEALIAVVLPQCVSGSGDALLRRAGLFFAGSVGPIEESRRLARESAPALKTAQDALTARTGELAAANDELKRETVRRQTAEESLRTTGQTSGQLLEKSRGMQTELRQLSRRLLRAQEEERKRISRELHDVIAQTLTGINLRLAGFKLQTTANAKDFHRKIAITQRLVEKSVNIVHRFARDLRPAVLDDLGLIPALKAYLQGFEERTGIIASFTAFADVEKLSSAGRIVLYRVAQEAVTNIARHAKATRVKVTIRKYRNAVRMEIVDDGRGFQVEGAAFAKRMKRLGLLGMRERIEMVGGTFLVESAPGGGTTVRADIPQTATGKEKDTTG